MKMPTGIQMIAAERRRQITKEKMTLKHDDQHADGTLGDAAACYERCGRFQENCGKFPMEAQDAFRFEPIGWPWNALDFKLGGSAVRTYVKAGALFQAEIDRILRLFQKQGRKNTDEARRYTFARCSLHRITETLDRLLK